jgi:hypothetical protein
MQALKAVAARRAAAASENLIFYPVHYPTGKASHGGLGSG